MRTYKFKLYNNDKNKYLDRQIDIAASVWNHTVALQRKYYKLFGKYASVAKIQKHHTKLKKTEKYRTKFVVDRNGQVVARFEPTADMAAVEACIRSLL